MNMPTTRGNRFLHEFHQPGRAGIGGSIGRFTERICDVFNVQLSTFFDEDKFEEITCDTVVRKNNRRVIKIDGSRSVMALFNSDLNHELEMILITAEPGAESGDVPHRHDGEECGIVIKGKMEIILDDKSYILDEGDSFYFSSERAHRWRNTGDGEMVSVWVITPPSF